MRILLQDVRYGLRMLVRNPSFTAVAVLTLAMGIGANTAIFTLLDAVMLRSLPVREPSHLFVFKWTARAQPGYNGYGSYEGCFDDGTHPAASGCSFSYPVFKRLSSQGNVFSGVTAFAGPTQINLSGYGPARMVSGELVSGEFFQTLGVRAALGRTLEPADDTPSADPAAVLNYGYWRSAFGGDPSAVGKTIRLNNVSFTVVGVAERQFTHLSPGSVQDLWVSLSAARRLGIGWVPMGMPEEEAVNWWLELVARTKPGISPAQAQGAASLLFRNEMLYGSKPLLKAADDPAIALVPAQKGLVGIREFFSKPIYVLMLAVGLVLLIACANIAGLTLARAASRKKEIAVRLSLGAGRMRIVRQLLTESVLLSAAGGALGIWLADWGSHSLTVFVSTGWLMPVQFDVQPDARILGFTIAVSVLSGALFGLAPAVRSARVDLTPALKESAGSLSEASHAGSRRFGLGSALVVAQVALSILVLVGAGLLVRTLANLKSIDPGFDTRNVLLFGIDPTLSGYKEARVQGLYRDLEGRLSSIPGVISASYSSTPLLSGYLSSADLRVEGRSDRAPVTANMLSVGPGFFETMRIPLLTGRTFSLADLDSATPKAIVNHTFTRRYLDDKNPLGMHFAWSDPKAIPWAIIGVVGDAKFNDLKSEIEPTAYIPLKGGGAHFELRTGGNPAAMIPTVRRIVSDLDNNLPLFDVRTQSEQIDQMLLSERLVARLAGLFGLLALVLTCVGLYGLLSYEVAQRTREFGIRVALGAQRRDVLSLVVRQGIALTVAGAVIGIAVAIGGARYLTSLLYGVASADPVTFAAVTALLVAVSLLACYIPARRATKVDPIVALHYE